MKKLQRTMLLAILTLCLCTGALSESMLFTEGQGGLPSSVKFTTVAIAENIVYAWEAYESALYAIDPSTQSFQTYTFSAPGLIRTPLALFETSGALYAVIVDILVTDIGETSYQDAGVYRLSVDQGALECASLFAIDLTDFISGGAFGIDLPTFYSLVLTEGDLFAVVATMGEGALYRFSAKEGVCTPVRVDGVRSILGAKEDKLMFVAQTSKGAATLCTSNFKGEEVQTLCMLPNNSSCYCYDAEETALYYLSDGIRKLASPKDKEATLLSNMPLSSCAQLVYRNGLLAARKSSQLFITSTDGESASLQQLMLNASPSTSALQLYLSQHPNVTVAYAPRASETEVISSLLTRSETPDVFFFRSYDSPFFASMRDRGYLAELTGKNAISLADSSFGVLRESLYDREGHLRAIPINVISNNKFGVQAQLWSELNLGTYPTTWMEFFDFLDRWVTIADKYPDIQLLQYVDARTTREMIGYLLRMDYENYRTLTGGNLPYGSEIYIELLNRLTRVNLEVLTYSEPSAGRKQLLTDYYLPGPLKNENPNYQMLPLSIDGTAPVQVNAAIEYACINPYSKNQELAQDFVDFLAANLEKSERACISSTFYEPVVSSGYEQSLADYRQIIEGYEAQLASITDVAEQTAIQLELDDVKRDYEAYVQENAYLITLDSIDLYRSQVSNGIVPIFGEGTTDAEILDNLFEEYQQFISGQLTAEEYTKALDQVVLMQELEQQ